MSNNWSRYSMIYKKAPRPNSVTPFSKHVFMRSQNKEQHKMERLGNRTDPFEATFVHLTERFGDRELFLVGSMNTSTMLAKRTRKLIRDINPDAVMVMTSPEWWQVARQMDGVDNQDEFDEYNKRFFEQIDEFKVDTSTVRGIIFAARLAMFNLALRWTYRTGEHFQFHRPGLEIKYACEEAEKLGADLQFLGPELNNITWHRLYHETRLNVPQMLFNRWKVSGTRWTTEFKNNHQKLQLTTPASYVETCCDQYLINWYIKSLELLCPEFKKLFIDKRDIGLYKAITKNTNHKRIVAVVNQWHMEGIEHLWAHEFGQLPRSQSITEEIDPIGDMELQAGLFDNLFNAFQREYKSALSKSTPSSYSNMINTYHREGIWQYEHRNM